MNFGCVCFNSWKSQFFPPKTVSNGNSTEYFFFQIDGFVTDPVGMWDVDLPMNNTEWSVLLNGSPKRLSYKVSHQTICSEYFANSIPWNPSTNSFRPDWNNTEVSTSSKIQLLRFRLEEDVCIEGSVIIFEKKLWQFWWPSLGYWTFVQISAWIGAPIGEHNEEGNDVGFGLAFFTNLSARSRTYFTTRESWAARCPLLAEVSSTSSWICQISDEWIQSVGNSDPRMRSVFRWRFNLDLISKLYLVVIGINFLYWWWQRINVGLLTRVQMKDNKNTRRSHTAIIDTSVSDMDTWSTDSPFIFLLILISFSSSSSISSRARFFLPSSCSAATWISSFLTFFLIFLSFLQSCHPISNLERIVLLSFQNSCQIASRTEGLGENEDPVPPSAHSPSSCCFEIEIEMRFLISSYPKLFSNLWSLALPAIATEEMNPQSPSSTLALLPRILRSSYLSFLLINSSSTLCSRWRAHLEELRTTVWLRFFFWQSFDCLCNRDRPERLISPRWNRSLRGFIATHTANQRGHSMWAWQATWHVKITSKNEVLWESRRDLWPLASTFDVLLFCGQQWKKEWSATRSLITPGPRDETHWSRRGPVGRPHLHPFHVNEAAWARAAAQPKMDPHLVLHTCSTRFCKMGGSDLVSAFANRDRNCRDSSAPTSPARTTNRALRRGPTNSGYVLSLRPPTTLRHPHSPPGDVENRYNVREKPAWCQQPVCALLTKGNPSARIHTLLIRWIRNNKIEFAEHRIGPSKSQ